MKPNNKFPFIAQALAAAFMIAVLAAACGGGSSAGFSQAYTATAGVGEVLQFSVDTAALTYSYSVSYTSYAASGVIAGMNGTGSLTRTTPYGSYLAGPSNDGFIQGGKILPVWNGMLAGHLQINVIGGANYIPLFGVSNPITSVSGLAGDYNYQGFSCNALGIANVYGNTACLSKLGTVTVTGSGGYTLCKGGDITTSPGVNACKATVTGTVVAQAATPGIFDFRNAANGHIGWFFAFSAANGRKVAVIDHDDSISVTPEYGHSVLSTYASAVLGASDGNYFVKNNESGEQLVAISGVTITSSASSGVSGALTLNSPWPGFGYYLFSSGVVASSGNSVIAGAGLYTYTNNADPAVFGVGIRY